MPLLVHHISEYEMFVHHISGDVNITHLDKVMSISLFHCWVTISPFVSKKLRERYYEDMHLSFLSLKIYPLILALINATMPATIFATLFNSNFPFASLHLYLLIWIHSISKICLPKFIYVFNFFICVAYRYLHYCQDYNPKCSIFCCLNVNSFCLQELFLVGSSVLLTCPILFNSPFFYYITPQYALCSSWISLPHSWNKPFL